MILTPLARDAYSEALDRCVRRHGVKAEHIQQIAHEFSDSLFRHYEETRKEPPAEYYLWRMLDKHMTEVVRQRELCAQAEARIEPKTEEGSLFQ